MTKKYVLTFHGFQGATYYDTYEEAVENANFRYNVSSMVWEVREILVP